MRRWLTIALLLPLSGCLAERDSFYVPTDIAPLFGGAVPVRPVQPAQPVPGSQAPATGAAKMLQDPEAEKQEWTEDLWVVNQITAESRCQEIADRESLKGNVTAQIGKPTQVYQKASKYGDYLFRCRFSTEVANSYTDDKRY